MKYIQAKLKNDDKILITWIEYKKSIKVGSIITLKGNSILWTIVDLYGECDKEVLFKQQTNNKQFGLSIDDKLCCK